MPFVDVTQKKLSDLIVYEATTDASGYTRKDINVAAGEYELGQVVFRAASLDAAAPYAKLVDNADIVSTNQFAVVFGDHYGFNEGFTAVAAGAGLFNAVAITQGPIKLKSHFVRAGVSALGAEDWGKLKEALEGQGIVVDETAE